MEGFLVLSDAASTDSGNGKVNLLGAGWSVTGPNVPASAVAGFLRSPWDAVNEEVSFLLKLVDKDGEPVRPFADTDNPVGFSGVFSLADKQPPDEVVTKLPLTLGFAIPIPPLPLEPGETFRWVLEADGVEVAMVDFAVRPKE